MVICHSARISEFISLVLLLPWKIDIITKIIERSIQLLAKTH